MKRIIPVLFVCIIIAGLAVPASADDSRYGFEIVDAAYEQGGAIYFDDMLCDSDINTQDQDIYNLGSESRATARIECTIRPNGMGKGSKPFTLEADEEVTINCTYSPRTADVDFGFITSDGMFHYVTGSDGSIKKTIIMNESGQYYFAVRNNTSRTIEVLGYVYY